MSFTTTASLLPHLFLLSDFDSGAMPPRAARARTSPFELDFGRARAVPHRPHRSSSVPAAPAPPKPGLTDASPRIYLFWPIPVGLTIDGPRLGRFWTD
jgi:hypothetical protein